MTFNNESQPKRINKKWYIIITSLLFLLTLSSIFLLVKIIIGLTIAIAVKTTSKAVSNILKGKQVDQNQVGQETVQSKITNLAIGLMFMLTGGISLLTVVQTGLASTCAVIAVLALHECLKDKEISKRIDKKVDDVADIITNFIISSAEKLISPQIHKT
ncbi:hypothetical protein GOY13_01290 [Wolbachia endosymbiont of Cruorifilaria tuberocauda]|uniref:hypothetical protein n=1 Tax=Wolbachia endosymbiont of Cruorifilaria tuberocauda TaxID=1812111 RepID=UPI0015896787|nr:hypothetical protein [Wolbachia endosymbiont of Cruorifilaria tuberocauda]QKX01583.1 hypothetical protein GOY13_01290 [Wolbachia endosymbiont of Cruorifilaria tuberocauda]